MSSLPYFVHRQSIWWTILWLLETWLCRTQQVFMPCIMRLCAPELTPSLTLPKNVSPASLHKTQYCCSILVAFPPFLTIIFSPLISLDLCTTTFASSFASPRPHISQSPQPRLVSNLQSSWISDWLSTTPRICPSAGFPSTIPLPPKPILPIGFTLQ